MALSYEEALATLQSMFSDQGYTSKDLDAVLRHHGGHMENTVETLLGHGDGSPSDLLRELQGGGATQRVADIDADEEFARQIAAAEEEGGRWRGPLRGGSGSARGLGLASGRSNFPSARAVDSAAAAAAETDSRARPSREASGPGPPAGTGGIGTPTTLPADFLRIPGRTYPSDPGVASASSTVDGPGNQTMSDEQLARMLQDKLFQEELLNNPEFSHLAGRRNPRASGAGYPGRQRVRSPHERSAGGSGGNDFFESLAQLGNEARSRFQQFAASWNDPNRAPLFGGGQEAARRQPQQRGNERRGLLSSSELDMEEEEEMDFVGGSSVEMQDKKKD